MAKAKVSKVNSPVSKSEPKPAESKKPSKEKASGNSLRGLRKAEGIGRQVERLKDKYDFDENAAEWLKFASALQATSEILYAQALMRVNPSKMKRPRAEPDSVSGD